MTEISVPRRDVFRAAALAMTASSYSRILGANGRVPMGVIGCGGRGVHVMGIFQKNPAVQIAAVCDLYGQRIDQAIQQAPGARGFNDHRKLLELKELVAV